MYTLPSLRYSAFVGILAIISGCAESSAQPEAVNAPVTTSAESAPTEYDRNKGLDRIHPKAVQLLGDTFGIVMYESVLQPGDSVVWHEHPYHTVYVLEGGSLTVYFEDMEPQPFELPKGAALIQPPLGDMAVNTGETSVRLLTHDLYSLNP